MPNSRFDALDSKAGIVLGFASTGIALAPDTTLWLRYPALALLVLAAGSALHAFLPRALPAIEVGALRDYLRAEEEFTMLRLHDTLVGMIQGASEQLHTKASAVRRAMLLLAASAPLLALGIAIGDVHV